jgi:hypothetical protein
MLHPPVVAVAGSLFLPPSDRRHIAISPGKRSSARTDLLLSSKNMPLVGIITPQGRIRTPATGRAIACLRLSADAMTPRVIKDRGARQLGRVERRREVEVKRLRAHRRQERARLSAASNRLTRDTLL